MVILPASYQDSLDFDIGYVSHRGYSLETLTTPIVMLDIGSMYGGIPVYLMVACTYHFKRFTKIFYTYNLMQNWKDKVYMYIISKLQAELIKKDPEIQASRIRTNAWKNWAITLTQDITQDRITRRDETFKAKQHSPQPSGQQQEELLEQNPEDVNIQKTVVGILKKKNRIIIGLIVGMVILFMALLFFVILPQSFAPTV
jgi:hypothetical protein